MNDNFRGMANQIFTFACVAVFLTLLFVVITLRTENKILKREVVEYTQTYKWKQGFTSFYRYQGKESLNYQLFSFDSGKSWYAIENGKILGEAEKVYPGLLTELDNWEKYEAWLMARPNDTKLTEKDIEYLKTLGFTIDIGKD